MIACLALIFNELKYRLTQKPARFTNHLARWKQQFRAIMTEIAAITDKSSLGLKECKDMEGVPSK
jgi:hypothetical protein